MKEKEKEKGSGKKKAERPIRTIESIVLLLAVVVLILLNARKFGIGTGLSVLSAAMLCGAYAMLVLHISWDELVKDILRVFQIGMGAVLILLMVGFIGASWTAAGTTPMLIYYGLKLVSPGVFLVVAFLLCAVMGMATGSAWAIIGSVGLALFGVGQGLGIPAAPAAAAIATGAYVGDKWSPFSDVPNLNAAITRGNSFDVFKSMLPTEIPSLLLTSVIYGIMGLQYAGGTFDSSGVTKIMNALDGVYHWNILLLVPPIIVVVFAALKYPVIPVLTASSLSAVIMAVVFQGQSGSKAFNVLYSGVAADTGNAAIDKLLSGGGLTNMMGLLLIIFCAFIFAGIIERMGLLNNLLEGLTALAKNRGLLVLSSLCTSVLSVYLTASVYVASILNTRVWKDTYKKSNMSSLMLARTMSAGMSNWGMLVPWSGGAAVVAGAFDVGWWEYAPFCFSIWFSMLFVLLWGFTGKFITPLEADEKIQITENV